MTIRLFRWAALMMAVLALAAGALMAQDEVELEPFQNTGAGISAVRPVGWRDAGGGIYARQQTPADQVILAIQSAPATIEQVMPSLLPQLGLTEVPQPADTVSFNGLDWTVYQTDISAPTGDFRADWALAEQNGKTFVLLMTAPEADYEALHEQVFLPVLESVAPLAEATPEADVPYTAEDVSFPGGSADVTLAGALTLPEGDGPFPAVVLMTGSGPQDRDESLAPLTSLKPFAIIADALTRAGVAVLRYDDRGTAQSTGDYQTAEYDDFVSDASAAIDYLLTRDDIDASQVGVLGHSEGGMYAARLAATRPELAFAIGMAPAVVSGVDVIIQQQDDILASQGVSDEERAISRRFTEQVLPMVIAGDLDGAEALAREVYGGLYDRQDAATQTQLGDRAAFIDQNVSTLMSAYRAPWYVSLLSVNPAEDWATVTIPTLAIFGGKDIQVDAEQNAAAFEAAMTEAGNQDFTVVTLPDANHLFQAAETGYLTEYSELAPQFTPDFLPTLLDWVLAHVRVVE